MVKIYTRTGDSGETSLFGGKRVRKDDLRVEAYGTVDELNSAIGVAIAEISNFKYQISNIKSELKNIQSDLFEVAAVLATPKDTRVMKGQKIHRELPRYLKKRVEEIEQTIDVMTDELPPLQAFILPGGGRVGALLHCVRTVCRRAERRIIQLSNKEYISSEIIMYLNRLSDLLFTMARFVNHREKYKEILWNKYQEF